MKQFDGRINSNKWTKFCLVLFVYFVHQTFYSMTKSEIWQEPTTNMQSIDAMENEKTVYPELRRIVGSSVEIPCNITLSSASDAVKLILWYKGSDISGSPIYSVDARSLPLSSAQHFISSSYENRAVVDLSVRPAILKISRIVDSDDGQYWCRVDFRWTRTTISVVTISVIVAPISLLLKDMNGIVVNDTIIVNEHENIRLVCEVYGGKPSPIVKWYHNSVMIDESYKVRTKDKMSIVENELLLTNVSRNQLFSSLMCESNNSNLTKPMSTRVKIDINLRPLIVHVFGPVRMYLSSGVKTEVICQTFGCRPAAIVRWFISQNDVTHLSESFSEQNLTQSVLKFTPDWSDDKKELICRAENSKLSNATLEEAIVLHIRYSPIVNLSFGNSDKTAFRLNEGSEIVLNCIIHGVITSNTTLIIKSANRQHEGRYECMAFNAEGRGVSNNVRITIDYAPVCVTEAQNYSLRAGDILNMSCELDAKPDNLTFFWTVNNVVSSDIKINYWRLKSWASYQPLTASDFGIVRCWGRNSVGFQSIPCLFNVSMSDAVVPSKLTNCSINTTVCSISVECIPGFDGGSLQSFHLEVYDSRRKVLLRNMTSATSPSFKANNLTSGATYVLIATASNGKGRSSEVTLIGKTLSTKISIEVAVPDTKNPVIMILIWICASLIGLIGIIFTISKIKNMDSICFTDLNKSNRFESRSSNRLEDVRVRSPDVIPNSLRFFNVGNTNAQKICNGNVLAVRDLNLSRDKIVLCNSSAYVKRKEYNDENEDLDQVESFDQTNKILDEDIERRDDFLGMKNEQIVIATIENDRFNEKYFCSYSTPV